jgi:hypothetical protein
MKKNEKEEENILMILMNMSSRKVRSISTIERLMRNSFGVTARLVTVLWNKLVDCYDLETGA